MGDTENGSWGSRELGGYIRREESRKEWEAKHRRTPWKKVLRENWLNILLAVVALALAGWIFVCVWLASGALFPPKH